jgi:uncharacterized surface anchored protein
VVPVLLLLAVALAAPTSAVAAETTNKEGLSGYGKTEEKKAEETKKPEEAKKPEEKAGTSPSKETSTPESKETAPTSTTSSGTSPSSQSTKSSTLPFTGFDLRWTLGMGLLLVGAGFLLVSVQRHHRRDGGR